MTSQPHKPARCNTSVNRALVSTVTLIVNATRSFVTAFGAGLRGMVHVSTAYVNSNKRKELDPTESGQVQEKIYEQWYHDSPQSFYEWVLSTDSDHIQSVLPNLLCGMPNTYTFSKQLAEILLEMHRGDLSLAIVRPTRVGASFREPIPGWIDKVGAGATVAVLPALAQPLATHGGQLWHAGNPLTLTSGKHLHCLVHTPWPCL